MAKNELGNKEDTEKIGKFGHSIANFVVFKPQKHLETKTSSVLFSEEHFCKFYYSNKICKFYYSIQISCL